eukprot:gnl/TRDRNA2_/TRDRNA2_139151_c0_seq2.p1 gnl/TRDRNA2_/TRDRNA2_139151_c0~~gnl/TRDRNA2_/TRDRNA2_139151_c0_seq2.p1  ORF type:complete len:331 (+),score=65.89 gnl/TRDRNA2_/TRDRNA2_139151_c0_seq2:67-1059(+)
MLSRKVISLCALAMAAMVLLVAAASSRFSGDDEMVGNDSGTCADSDSEEGDVLLQRLKLNKGKIIADDDTPQEDIPSVFYGHRVHRTPPEKRAALLLEKPGLDIKQPSTKPLNLARGVQISDLVSYSQWSQDTILAPILTQIHNGFFVESGAFDGEGMSNSIYYEIRGWTGLMIEPDPKNFQTLMTKNRKAYAFEGALSPTNHSELLQFNPMGGNGQLDHEGSYTVQAEPLTTLLQAIDPARKTVDFWSLDIEGSEGSVLSATDFSKIEVGLVLVEMNKSEENNRIISAVMVKNGFVDIGGTKYDGGILDHVFVNPKYFKARNLQVPTHI